MNRKEFALLRSSGFVVKNLLVLFLVVVGPVGVDGALQYKVAHVPEASLRQWAKVSIMPIYPEESKRRNAQGVAVANLSIDEQGNVSNVEILESPDEATGRAVADATRKWKFLPGKDDSDGKPIRLQGKLTFYFVVEGQNAYVKNPKQFS